MIDVKELQQIAPRTKQSQREQIVPLLNAAMLEFNITGKKREAAFIAQLCHESGQFRWFEELASGAAYEGRVDLGNTQPGDGRRFKGRGPLQITGRANYAKYGKLLGIDLIAQPELAADPTVAFRLAACWWADHGLNDLADQGDFLQITKVINGGTNGWQDRLEYYKVALTVLGDDDPVPANIQFIANGRKLRQIDCLMIHNGDEDLLYVAVRQLCNELGWRLEVLDHVAKVFARSEWTRAALTIVNNVGYVWVRDLPFLTIDASKFSDGIISIRY